MPAPVHGPHAAPAATARRDGPGRPPRHVLVGVGAGLVVFLGAAVLALVSLPWKGTGDSYFHLDYAYQVWTGSVPEPRGPVLDSPMHPRYPADARQYASAHPPLLYALAAPLVGPLIDSGHAASAIGAMRGLVLVFGVLTYLLLAYTGWVFGGSRRETAAVGLPLLGTLTTSFVRFSSEVYNDVPVTFFSVAAITLTLHALRDGVSRRHALLMGLVVACGAATKSTFLLTAAVVGVFFLVAAAWHRPAGTSRVRAVVAAAWPSVVLPTLLVGWFFVLNAVRSGNPVRSTPKLPLPGRTPKTLADNLTNPDFWLVYPKGFFGSTPWRDLTAMAEPNRFASLVLVACAASLVALWLVRHRPWATFATGPLALAPALLVLHLAAIQTAQLYHAIGYGAYNWRYFLPTTLQAGLLLLLACLTLRRGSRAAVVGLSVALWLAATTSVVWYVGRKFVPILDGAAGVAVLPAATAANGLPAWLPLACTAMSVAATCVVALALHRADRPVSASPPQDDRAPSPRSPRRAGSV